MCQTSRYINLFTDFGFKKIFGDPDNTELLKSLLNDILQFEGAKKIKDTFTRAEFISMPKSEQENYHKNLKVYRALVNSFDFAYKEGVEDGIEQKKKEIVELSIEQGLDNNTICAITGISIKEIEKLRKLL